MDGRGSKNSASLWPLLFDNHTAAINAIYYVLTMFQVPCQACYKHHLISSSQPHWEAGPISVPIVGGRKRRLRERLSNFPKVTQQSRTLWRPKPQF